MALLANSKVASGAAINIEAELAGGGARAQLVHYDFSSAQERRVARSENFRIELCLTPGRHNLRACFPDQWNQNRFERMGHFFLIPPEVDVIVRSDGAEPLTAISFELDTARVCELMKSLPSLSDSHLVSSLDLKASNVRNLLVRAAEETRHPGFASSLWLESIALQMAIELVRYGNEVGESHGSGRLAPWQLRRIDERLAQTGKPPSLNELAELCRISVRQLARSFRNSRNCSIGAFVANSRFEHAKRLLASDHNINDVALVLGFSDSSNFCYAFKRETGLTPGQYRQTLLT